MGSAGAYKFLREISSTSQILHPDAQTVSSSLCAFNCIVKNGCVNIRFISAFYSASSSHAFPTRDCHGVPHHGIPPVRWKRGQERHPDPPWTQTPDGERALWVSQGEDLLSFAFTNFISDQIEVFSRFFNTFHSLFFSTVSEGSDHHRPNHEGLGCQWGWRGELWGVCVFGCGFVHRLWGLLQGAVNKRTKLEPMSLCWCVHVSIQWKTIKTTFAARLKYSGCVWRDLTHFGLQTR